MKSRILAADSNDQLVARYANARDEAAFAELVRRFGPMVLGVSRRLLASHEDADDATQLVFAELARRAGTIEDPEAVAGWLHTITVRVAHRLRRRQPNTEPLVADPLDPRLSLEDLGKRSDLEVLSQELDQLPASWREPLLLRYFAGLSNEAVATQLGTTVTALEGRLKRGRNSLRVRLLRRGVGVAGVLAVVGPASVSAATDAPADVTTDEHWNAVTDAAENLSSDPATLTFLPAEPTTAAVPLITSKAILATTAAAVVLAVLGGGGELAETSATAIGGPISTVIADDQKPTSEPTTLTPTPATVINTTDTSNNSPQSAIRQNSFSFVLDGTDDLLGARPLDEAWKAIIAAANKELFEPNGSEIRYVDVDEEDGEVSIDVPNDVDGLEALFLKYVFERSLQATEARLREGQRSFQASVEQLKGTLDFAENAFHENPSVPDWVRQEFERTPAANPLVMVPSLDTTNAQPGRAETNPVLSSPPIAAESFPETEAGWQRETFMSEDMDELINGRPLDVVWREIVEAANNRLFRPHRAEIRYVGIDDSGDAVVDYPQALVGAGALLARFAYEEQKRALADEQQTLEKKFLDRTQSEAMALQPPEWIRKSLTQPFGTAIRPQASNPVVAPGADTLLKAMPSVKIEPPLAQTPRRLRLLSDEQASEFLRRLQETVQRQTSGWASIAVELGVNRKADGKTIQSRYVTYSGTVKARTPGVADANRARNAIGRLVWNSAERVLDEMKVSLLDALTSPPVDDPFAASDNKADRDAPFASLPRRADDNPVLNPNHERTLDVFIDEDSATGSMASTLETIRGLFGERRIKVFDINGRDGAHVAKYYGVRSAPAFLLLSPHLDKSHDEMVPETLYEQPLTTEQIVGVLMSNEPVAGAENLARPERFVPNKGVMTRESETLSDDLQPVPAVVSPQPLRQPTVSQQPDQRPDEFPLNVAGITDSNNPPTPAFWRRVIERFQELVPDSGQMEFDIPKQPQAFMMTKRPWFNDDDPDAVAKLSADVALLHQSMMVELARDRRLLIDGRAISLADLVEDNPKLMTPPLEQVLPQAADEASKTGTTSANDLIPLAEGRYMLWFTQPGCEVCEAMRPDIEQTKAAFDVGRVREFDITTPRGRAVAKAYGVSVFATPATVVTGTSSVSGFANAQVTSWGRLAIESLIPMLTTKVMIPPEDKSWRTSGTAVPGREEHAERWKNGESPRRWTNNGGGFY